jgi:two-component system nitrogen regulation sensor histidine kinase NtrY
MSSRISLRTKYVAFIAIIHLAALIMSYFVFEKHKTGFLLSEVLVLISLGLSWSLYHELVRPVSMLQSGATAVSDKDFTVKLIATGAPELDALIDVYNRMMDALRQERVLQEEKHYFLEKLIHTSPTGLLTLDFDGKVTSINPAACRLTGLAESAVLGRDIGAFAHPLLSVAGAIRPDQSQIIELSTARRYKVQKTEFIDRGFKRAFVLIEELTAEIMEAEKKAYNKLIRMMSHEVNNSVGAVNSILDSARRAEKNEKMAHALGVAIERNEHLGQLMRRFSDVARIPAPHLCQFDLHAFVRNIIALMRPLAAERGIGIAEQFSDQPLWVRADQPQMEQVLINVIKNAIEAGRPNGHISVETTQQPTELLVIDDGHGITPDVEPLIFTPFFSNKNGGQGVGLTLVRDILMQHRFMFSLRTEAPGRTVFRIRF